MQFWKKHAIASPEEEKRWERWRIIFSILEDKHVASCKELLEATGAKAAVLEKDIASLVEAGLVNRTVRNAVTLEAYRPEKTLEERSAENREIKLRAARLVVEKYLRPGMTVFCDASTTVKAIAPFIADKKLLIITGCLSLIEELRGLHFTGDIICTGGTYRAISNSLVGEAACDMISAHKADLALIGTDGVSSRMEVMEAHPFEALLKRAMIMQSARTLVMALPEKFRDNSLLPVVHLSKIEALISSDFPDPEFVKAAKACGVRLECPG